ncbi:MAG: hypoxanthine phosphoribosyltransferase [Proteobacteria bacterium]|jgi:hypoxanthine phosphoribosyltransferase|nr:hypoxanthine phosphoribosyltransferase [Pseudomonadota bacterium]
MEILIDQQKLATRIRELGQQISEDYRGKSLICIGVLKGCVLFMSDLIRQIDGDVSIDFMGVSSYRGKESTGVVQITLDLRGNIEGKDVLIVEDIVDSGLTLQYLMQALQVRNPESLRIVTLLNKSECRKVEVPLDYVGFEIPNAFVVGYGLDLDERFRNLSHIAIYDGE